MSRVLPTACDHTLNRRLGLVAYLLQAAQTNVNIGKIKSKVYCRTTFTSERVNTVKTYRPTTVHKSQLKLNSTSTPHKTIALRLTSDFRLNH